MSSQVTMAQVKDTVAKFYGAQWLLYVIKQGGWESAPDSDNTRVLIDTMEVYVYKPSPLKNTINVAIYHSESDWVGKEVIVNTLDDLPLVTELLKQEAIHKYIK